MLEPLLVFWLFYIIRTELLVAFFFGGIIIFFLRNGPFSNLTLLLDCFFLHINKNSGKQKIVTHKMWNSTLWAAATRKFLSMNLLSAKEYDTFLERRQWLQKMVSGFDLRTCLGESHHHEAIVPRVLIYGSSVAGTAFVNGDVDFAVAFPCEIHPNNHSVIYIKDTPVPIRYDSGCAVVDREAQPIVLSNLYQHLSNSQTKKFDCTSLQRIFRARIPIMQFCPPEGSTPPPPVKPPTVGSASSASEGVFTVLLGDVAKPDPCRLPTEDAPLPSKKKEHFDISLSLDGCRNSLLLRSYMTRYPALRVAALVLKHWGRRVRILNARRGWISPYALTVMVVHYMHAAGKIPALIPPQEAHEQLASFIEGQEEWHSLRIPDVDLHHGSEDVATILKGFFEYYAHHFDFDVDVVDIRTSQRLQKRSEWERQLKEVELLDEKNVWHRLGHAMILLRDPFECHSLGRSVEFFRAEGIREELRKAALGKGLENPEVFFSCPWSSRAPTPPISSSLPHSIQRLSG